MFENILLKLKHYPYVLLIVFNISSSDILLLKKFSCSFFLSIKVINNQYKLHSDYYSLKQTLKKVNMAQFKQKVINTFLCLDGIDYFWGKINFWGALGPPEMGGPGAPLRKGGPGFRSASDGSGAKGSGGSLGALGTPVKNPVKGWGKQAKTTQPRGGPTTSKL